MSPTPTPGSWTLDPTGTDIRITGKSIWGLVTVRGVFGKVSGSGEVLADGTAHGSLALDASSLDTKHAKRDAHLRSKDFFHAEEHPEIVFTAQQVTARGDGSAEVAGELTVRGTTRPLRFTAKTTELSADAVTFSAEVAIDRTEWGITFNQLGMMKPVTIITLVARFTRS